MGIMLLIRLKRPLRAFKSTQIGEDGKETITATLIGVHNWTGTQLDWDTTGLGHNGTGTQRNWGTTGLGHNGIETQWDWDTTELGHNGTGTQWDWDTMGWDTMGRSHCCPT